MIKFFKNLYLKRLIKKYQKNSYIYGEMISYAYMGKPVGFDNIENKQKKYELLLINNNLTPYSIRVLIDTGYGRTLHELHKVISKEDKDKILQDLDEDRKEIHNVFQIDLANKL